MTNHAGHPSGRGEATNHATCTRCRHPRPLHDADGTGICKARGCHAGPDQGACRAFMPAAGQAAPVPVAAAVQAGPIPPMLVDVYGAATLLRLGRCSVLKLADQGELPRVRFGTSVRFSTRDLEDLVERRKQEARPAGSQG